MINLVRQVNHLIRYFLPPVEQTSPWKIYLKVVRELLRNANFEEDINIFYIVLGVEVIMNLKAILEAIGCERITNIIILDGRRCTTIKKLRKSCITRNVRMRNFQPKLLTKTSALWQKFGNKCATKLFFLHGTDQQSIRGTKFIRQIP